MKNPTLWLIIAMSLVLACGAYLIWDSVHNGTNGKHPLRGDVPNPRDMAWRPALARNRRLGEALKPVRELHKPFWDNCINACCSGEQCKHRSRLCEAGCDEYWPCPTARLVYSADELDPT